jgi:DNA-binding IclR family transcriptional regulator
VTTAHVKDDREADSGSRSVVDRALSILGTFEGNRTRQALSDISRHSGLPIATCYRIVQRLVEWGALERDSENRYRIGLRLWEVASRAPRSEGLQRIARPFLLDLYETTGYATHLAIREGTELVSIERFHSPRRQVRRPMPGKRYDMHTTAIGQVLLAWAPPDVQQAVLEGELRQYTPYTHTQRATLEPLLAEVRRVGYAVSDRQVDMSHLSIAAPVRGADGSVIAGLSLAFGPQDTFERSMVHLVQLTATSLSRALTARGFHDASE